MRRSTPKWGMSNSGRGGAGEEVRVRCAVVWASWVSSEEEEVGCVDVDVDVDVVVVAVVVVP